MEQSTVAEHLDRMESCGLLSRKQGDADKRMYRIFLTGRARAMAPGLIAELEKGARIFTQGISRQDLKLFHTVILKIVDNLYSYIRTHEDSKTQRRKLPVKSRKTKSRMPRAGKKLRSTKLSSASAA
jgi:hypothetical protein